MSSVIEIRPLSRVEGHGRVTVFLDGGKVEKVALSLFESPRLFEALLQGKSYEEVPEIICRICSICSSVHRTVSLLAIEKALGIEVSPQTRLYRELIVNGGHMESHALHLFCLVLPDHYEAAGFAELAAKAPEALKMGLRIKGAGNLVQETVGGRLIHPVTLVPGGMGKPPGREELLKLRKAMESVLPDTVKTFELFSSFAPPADDLATLRYMGVQSGSSPPLFGERLVTSGKEPFPVEDYRENLREEVQGGTNAKRSLVEGGAVVVGALARLNLGMGLSAKAAEAFGKCRERIVGADIHANNLAQAVELIHAVERSTEIIDTLLGSGFHWEKPAKIIPRGGTGSAVIEAPRGILVHSYAFDGRGRVTSADIVTPTAVNQAAMERDLLALARSLEDAGEDEMKQRLEVLVRAFDPCISCAVHLVRR